MVQGAIFPADNLEKQARETQQLASEKEKQDFESNNYWFNKKSSNLD